MKQALRVLILFFLVFLSSRCFAFTIDSPPDKSILKGNTVSFIVTLTDGEADGIRILDNNLTLGEKEVSKSGKHLCLQTSLDYGLHTLEIQGLQNGSITRRQAIQIYLQGRLGTNTKPAPAMFTPYSFHTGPPEKTCTPCHQMAPTPADFTPDPPESSSCEPCHLAKTRGAVIHYPANKRMCLFCHHVDGPKEKKYVLHEREQEYCYTCHSDSIKKWQNQPVIHGPVGKGQCSLCHDSHSSSKDALLRLHTTDLCITCHEDKATGAHVISGFYGKGHPVRGVRDPLNPEREFTCAGCHNPHAGKNRDLLRHDRKNLSEYCLLCHKL